MTYLRFSLAIWFNEGVPFNGNWSEHTPPEMLLATGILYHQTCLATFKRCNDKFIAYLAVSQFAVSASELTSQMQYLFRFIIRNFGLIIIIFTSHINP